MGNIVLLDDLTINKIAAGEVIERPASVVKELVENSIDAGSDNISIEIRNGGISYIRITDNGKGIQEDDLEIAFERHATSKIRKVEDLEVVKSMGFRGEALASIAAIARVELTTKTEDSNIGYRIVVEGGKIISKEEVGCPKGTTITVENLFYNTPVRYKFLKKDFTESGYIEDVVARIALVNPNIAIKLINTGKTVIQTSGNGEIKDIVYGIYGKDIAENIINVEYQFEDMVVKGVIGKPSIARSNRANQLFFVNKRYVKDKTLTSAAEQGFKGNLSVGKYGFLILDLEIDPSKLDVNVHPAKLEVRFQDEGKIFKLVYHAIKEALLSNENTQTRTRDENDALSRLDIIDDYARNYFAKKSESANRNEGNRIGKFFKNIIGGNKKESDFDDDDEPTVVEQVYNQKFKKEKNNVDEDEQYDNLYTEVNSSYLENDNSSSDSNNSYTETNYNSGLSDEEYNALCNPNPGVTYNLRKELDDLNKLMEEQEETERLEKNALIGPELENLIIRENGSIKLKDSDEENKQSPNYQRLMKELDDNIEKLNYKQHNEETEKVDEENQIYEINSEELDENSYKFGNEESYETVINEGKTQINNVVNNANNQNNNETKYSEYVQTNSNEFTNTYETNNISESIVNETSNVANNKVEETEEKFASTDEEFAEMYEKMFGTSIVKKSKEEEEQEEINNEITMNIDEIKTAENISFFTNTEVAEKPVYKFIGIAFNTHIIIEYQREMYIIDQYAANEKILYEKLKESFYSGRLEKESQLMLLPDIINVTDKQIGIINDNINLFKSAGFVVEEFGDKTYRLSSVPEVCIDLDTRELFIKLLNEVNKVDRTSKQEVEERFIYTIASRIAEKSKMATNEQEADILMQQLLILNNPFMCQEGKPVAIRMTRNDIEKKFSRR